MIIYSKKLLFKGHQGTFYALAGIPWTVIVIDPDHADDEGLLAHEKMHREQYKRQPWTYTAKMFFSDSFRLQQEIECYSAQIDAYPSIEKERLLWLFAEYISTRYNIFISVNEAWRALKDFNETGKFTHK